MKQDVAAVLGADGLISKRLNGFAPRTQQLQLADAVQTVLQQAGTLVAEAGTGIGKTFAYLVPALLAEQRVLISTGTKHLQDQLFHRDLPVVKQALHSDAHVALLKGRANYLCLHRYALAEQHPSLRGGSGYAHLHRMRLWAATTRSGDVNDLQDVPEDSPVWPLVTSTTENCLGQECTKFQDCFVLKARREAQRADVVVVNHHLFFADLALKEEGFGEILPDADAYILDEAHQLPDIATHFFGDHFSSRQVHNLVQDTIAEQLRDAPDAKELRQAAEQLQYVSRDFRLLLGVDRQKAAWSSLQADAAIQSKLLELQTAVKKLHDHLELAKVRGAGLEACAKRADIMQMFLSQYQLSDADTQRVLWFETFSQGYSLNTTPLDVATLFQGFMQARPGAWLFTSATLTVGQDFSHFSERLGLQSAQQLQISSPFDYRKHALLYLPADMPEPNAMNYDRAVLQKSLPAIRAAGGRTFILFTSHRALQAAAAWLPERIEYPVLVQGTVTKQELLQQFRELGNAVLLGTASFWEGVDVRGEALSCVIIDKLPFASPGDPVLQAKLHAVRSQGKNPFMDYQLPQAVVTLKQGVGRLIRDVNDRGLLMLCDPRLRSKPYGRIFLESLPDMQLTSELAQVEAFFAELATT